jgi:hypothetical protein
MAGGIKPTHDDLLRQMEYQTICTHEPAKHP